MYKCPYCIHNTPTIKFLIAHIKFAHGASLSTIICKQENCTRSFVTLYSFKRHLMVKHLNENNTKVSVMPELHLFSENVESMDDKFTQYTNSKDLLSTNVCKELMNNPSMSLQQFDMIVTKSALLLVSKLYADITLSRLIVHKIIQYVNNFYKSTIEIIKHKLECQGNRNVSSDINDMCIIIQNIFLQFETEHKTLQYFIKHGYLIMPQSINIAATLCSKRRKMCTSIGIRNRTVQVIPLRQLLIQFLELSNVFDTITKEIYEKRHNDILSSVLHGEVWKHIQEQFSEKFVLPLLLYFDDFEINNPLGSHSGIHKIGVVYCTIPCIPSEYFSILENIFLLQIHNAKDHSQLGNKNTFFNIINQIQDLETNGLLINIHGRQQTIYFALVGIIGDNLGLHTIFGFNTSFNSTYSCRACLVDKSTLQMQISENSDLLRTRLNYANDCSALVNGIQEECVFNKISSFHVIDNICFDIMHDIFEGICRYEIAKILNNLIHAGTFSLDTLNDRIRFFDYPIGNNKNIPPLITKSSLKHECLVISASEMFTLVKFLGLMIGDLISPKSKIWELYTILREIICIIMEPTSTKATCKLLENLIAEHQLYLSLFKEPLKPKHHFLIHYPRIIIRMGPLRNLSCIRFEAKHKEIKQYAKVITSRLNPPYTLARDELGDCASLWETDFSKNALINAPSRRVYLEFRRDDRKSSSEG